MGANRGFIFTLRELSGGLGDLGTLLPLTLACVLAAGLSPAAVLGGFGLFYLATAGVYRLPIPVQPMKAVAAVAITAQVAPPALALGGVAIGALLLVLGLTGWIGRVARLIPKSVLAGLQLGLGAALAAVGAGWIATAPTVGLLTLAVLLGLLALPRCPAALLGLVAAVILGWLLDAPVLAAPADPGLILPSLPVWPEVEQALGQLVLPQLPLTLTNAVILTALVAQDYFGERAASVTPRALCLTSGLANLLLTPFGALPMCHGAGGLAAHHRFGARSGGAPLMLGLLLLALALLPGGGGWALAAAIPAAGLGALLLVAAGELALTRRLFDSRRSCWPVIAATAAVTVWQDPFWGLMAGMLAEAGRVALLRRFRLDPASS